MNRSEYSFLRDLAQSIPDVQMGDLGMEDTNATVDGGGGGPDVPVDFSLRGQQTKPAFGKIVRSSTMTTSGEQTEPAAPRPRGRPRKRPISEDPISFSSSTASLVTPNSSFIGATYEGRNKIERTSNSDANLSSMKGPSSSSTTISSSSMDALTNVMGLNASVRTKQVHQTTKASTSSTSISSKLSKNQHEYNINNDSDDTSDDYDNNNEDDSDDDQNSDENQDDYGELDEGEARRAVANLSSIDGGQMQMQRTSVLVANPIPASVSTASSKIVVEDDDYDNF